MQIYILKLVCIFLDFSVFLFIFNKYFSWAKVKKTWESALKLYVSILPRFKVGH